MTGFDLPDIALGYSRPQENYSFALDTKFLRIMTNLIRYSSAKESIILIYFNY